MAAKEKVDAAKLEEYLERCDYHVFICGWVQFRLTRYVVFGFDAY